MGNQKAISATDLRRGLVVLAPAVTLDGAAFQDAVVEALSRVEVDSHLHLPDMFTLTFADPQHDVLTAVGLKLGSKIEIKGGIAAKGGDPTETLLIGEITAIEGSYDEKRHTTVVRGYTADHRLQRVRRTRTFLNMSDSDAAAQIAKDAGLTIGTIDASGAKHPHLGQRNITDWAYLTERAREIGYEVGVRDDKFYFRKAGSDREAAAVTVDLKAELLSFDPRVSAGNLAAEAEVRSWDPVNAKVIAARKPTAAPAVPVGVGTPGSVLTPFARAAPPPPAGGAEAGPPPSPKAHVLNGHGLTLAQGNSEAVEVAARALAERATSGLAEARAVILGDAQVLAGASLTVTGVPAPFTGAWMVTSARHVFDADGYRTHVTMSGRADRSLLALTGGTGSSESGGAVPGVVCGLVTDIADPDGLGRVKVVLPWLSPDYETDWAPVSQLDASAAGGALFLPSPKDQVLVAFEHGDLRRPYVLGSLVNKRTGAGGKLGPGATAGASAVKAGNPAAVIRRGILTPSGSRLVFHDEVPPSGGKPTVAQVVLGTAGDKISLTLDQVAGTLAIACSPGGPPGKLSISCDGNIDIKAGPSGTLNVDGGAQLNLTGKAVTIEGTAIEIKGTAAVTVKGKPITLN